MTTTERHPIRSAEAAAKQGSPSTAPKKRKRISTAEKKRRRAGWLMITPSVIHVGLWTLIPVIATFYLSFTDYGIFEAPKWIWFDNYVEMFNDAVFMQSIGNTIWYTFWTVPVSMAVAVVVAVLLNQGLKLQKFYRTAFFLPQVTATVAIAMVWLWIFNPQYGLLNAMLETIGIPGQAWLVDPQWALPSVILVGAWQGIGIKMLIYIAALQNIDESLYEAASLDGASSIRKFFSITVPMLKPATFFVFIISIIGAFQVFDQIYVLTDGGPANATTMMTYEVYRSAFQEFRMGMASAQSVVLFAFLLFVTLISRRVTKEED
ncbi:sugar ABC transporter permease [Salinibacterium sp. NSLL150]|uniref:carbohydrate ABC transporter permease n=1 Tax=unclassified Salinibacterium TaxID=2632331 RepID=UPI0018CF0D22|nr:MULTISPECIES: sugar ABC transporter permease [unclassified Salinibacterium]MBH0097708.1 sugar ABC transporter permease [Salinibacterium sp. NSLL35]MBH0100463.1 sugar ABC transporter permease [Salinibacterium sp. NSLL150]MBH0103222.1 sugar ABC transporter permease [Salinibacterium sp. NSLL16]MBH0105983.1 sugar ABC transporter permease [Salinibacterium sp. NSLL17]MBH0110243.1 sugar ABC transporter permease [Salinibacterium sp. NG22]